MEARPYIPAHTQVARASAEEASADRLACERKSAEEEAAKGDTSVLSISGIGGLILWRFTSIRHWLQHIICLAPMMGFFRFLGRLPVFGSFVNKNCLSLALPADQMLPARGSPQPYSEGTDREREKLVQEGSAHVPGAREVFSADYPPPSDAKVLLHSCCAPCSGAMFEEMRRMGLKLTIFFYNPNIHPRKEYEIRKNENKRYCEKYAVPFVDCDYDDASWFDRMKGLEYDPERIGVRCTACFDMRMEVTAKYAYDNGFDVITSTNATSRWKCQSQVDGAGIKATTPYFPNVRYWIHNWQTDAFTQRKYEISVEERFYKQEYCGCSYSLRDSNLWRKQQGIPPVKIGGATAGLGTRYFEDAVADAEEESQEVVDQFFGDATGGFGLDDRHTLGDPVFARSGP
eukprot:TRINITY_DN48721_c0_g1_i1.p1 TRINITY_DN48721_c0_g1~~TRINITY_DN48721_c0_g1_i1.p1  ORF type:complete len:402 (+),score=70.33 TRINITY_DN48721_c0_g1_i1:43-1248(+)